MNKAISIVIFTVVAFLIPCPSFVVSANEIEEIIRLTDEYGKDKVLAAFNKVTPWDEANPKRSMAYVTGILRSRNKL